MTTPMSCERFAETVSELLERDVTEPTRAAMEWHAVECGDCGALLADLRKLRVDAANLPVLAPSRDLWAGIAARIDAPVIPLTARSAPADARIGRHGAWARWARMSAAAAVLVAATAATTYYLTVQADDRPTERYAAADTPAAVHPVPDSVAPFAPRVAATVDSASPVAVDRATGPATVVHTPERAARLVSAKPSAEQVYGSEIARLRALVERRRAQLDPVTVSVIERNLKVIDDAILQCRAALAKDPASRFLIESLNKALETKVELLRTAAMLPSRA